jgi:hypothetical protein
MPEPPLEFIHWCATEKIFASQCPRCNANIAYSPEPSLLKIAERAHLCPAAHMPPGKVPLCARPQSKAS